MRTSMPISRLVDLVASTTPFALLRRRTPGHDQDTVEVLLGPVQEVERLAEIPERELPVLALVPFRQIRERGFDVRDDGTPLTVLCTEERYEVPLAQALDELPAHEVSVTGGAFDVDDEAYAGIVERVIRDEIGSGEGANFVIRRNFEGRIDGFSRADALALFRRLLDGERGAYWTYVVHTGDEQGPGGPSAEGRGRETGDEQGPGGPSAEGRGRETGDEQGPGGPSAEGRGRETGGRTLVGASPEVHVRMTGGTVVMNPISGTYRYPAEGPTEEHLLDFLADGKEIAELSMVVDEELKMMCTVGDMGGVVVGPRLKEMSHLAHTEYELRGKSSLDVREVLKETMFAATVTGSPVQNACRVIERYEPGGRGYYAGALALIGRDAGGAQTLDSPILIRTADIDARGGLRVAVGATLVRDSDPAGEVAETHAKAAGVLAALGVRPGRPRAEGVRPRLADDARVREALDSRRASLAPFWLRMQERSAELSGHALVIDGEDTFTAMLAHLLRSSGLDVSVRRYDEPGLREAALAHEGPVVLGPGPGNPADAADPKMRMLRALTADLVREHTRGLLGVCLGHELLAAELGLQIGRKQVPYQGAQTRIELFGRPEVVGFYNSFVARCDDEEEAELGAHRVEVSRDRETGEVHALRGPGFASVQFHPESVLTLRGTRIVAELVAQSVLGSAGTSTFSLRRPAV
ncbi:anthranilate synthase family protein [Streptomyces sp. B-S-A8]|uniref:anthranilate synthase n=1 Tax=Streptomyces solicavernae TaxID=3043614 RepID=A0ABT6RRT0_9ACTN|nr:anthranilate synthase family protein [Streptomyces sp. B-S-A8]MDI3387153.1 anthranilate synthase family protein [Streptomyces sp. B-S-A8]